MRWEEKNRPESSAFLRFLDSDLLRGAALLTAVSVNVSDFAGGAKTGAAIQAAIDSAAAQGGGTVTVQAGSYSVTDTLTIPSNITLTGAPNDTTVLNMTLSSPSYGITLNDNDSNVTIESISFVSNYGVIGMYTGSGFTNITITNNALQFGGGSTSNGTAIFGIYGSVANHHLQITSNYFHDSPTSVRDWEIWDADNSNLDYNTLYNIVDGGHIVEPQANVSFSNNYGVHIHRMGQEIQGSTVGTGLKVNDNTFYDWVTPYYDSFGLSIVNHSSQGTQIERNYLKASIAAGSTYGITDSGGVHRFGYAIEAGGLNMTVDNNMIIGNWIAGIVASRLNVEASNNVKYGPANWGDWIGEPSIDGYGSLILSNDLVFRLQTNAPQPPALTGNPTYVYNPSIGGVPAAATDPGTGTGTTTTTTTTGTTTTPYDPGRRPTVAGPTTSTPTVATAENTGIDTSGNTVTGSAIELDPSQNTTPVVGTLGNLTITPLSSTTASITWSQAPVEGGSNNSVISVTQFEVDVQSTVGKEHFPSVVYSADLTSATVINLHPGWQIDFTVTAFMSNGTAYRSGPVTAMFSGNSLTPFTGLLWGGISSVSTPHG